MPDVLDLYELLPVHHRRRDAERGYPLRALLELLGEQGEIVRHGIDALWDDLFIETCDRWVIPYIGELVANDPLHDVDRSREPDVYAELFPNLAGPDLRPPLAVPLRADVARTIYYRRRKGTLPMLEELARDVTGWGAKVVEFFELLEWTQNDDHVRLHSPECAEVRRAERIERVDGPFDVWAHTADVRRIAQSEGWHNIPNIGFFLWRLRSYPLERVVPRPLDPGDPGEWRFHLSPLGNPAPLFTNPKPGGDERGRATELHVPAPIRRAFLYGDLVRYRESESRPRADRTDLYGPVGGEGSVNVVDGGVDLPPTSTPNADPDPLLFKYNVVCRRLDPWPPNRPTGNLVAIDPVSGRLALGQDFTADDPFEVSYCYGFGADLGGGPYERRAWLVVPEDPNDEVTVDGLDQGLHDRQALKKALTTLATLGKPERVITILDSRTYELPAQIELPWDGTLVIQAANGQRPLLVTEGAGLEVTATTPPSPDPEVRASLTLSGVVVEGHLGLKGHVRRLRLLHSTLIPGRRLDPDTGGPVAAGPSLEALDTGGDPIYERFRLEVAFSVTGGLRVAAATEGLWIYDSIVDGARVADATGVAIAGSSGDDSPAPSATLERVTVFGDAVFRELPLASESIFSGLLKVDRRQRGCVRFSWVRPGSTTPRRFRCQPDLAVAAARERARANGTTLSSGKEDAILRRITPWFTDRRYGQPGYAQLSLGTPAEIRAGSEAGSEMGAFCHLHQPQRETNLRIRLREYLPFGLVPGLIYVT